jgi:hypothetical protein
MKGIGFLDGGGECIAKNNGQGLTCRKCQKGKFRKKGSKTVYCSMCLPGTVSKIDGMEKCTYCKAGRYQNKAGAYECAECKPGFYGNLSLTCVPVASGYFSKNCSNESVSSERSEIFT